jgi:hypothetical protein
MAPCSNKVGTNTEYEQQLQTAHSKILLKMLTVPQLVTIFHAFNPLTPNDLYRHRAVSPLKIKIPSKNMREKPTNAIIIHSVY